MSIDPQQGLSDYPFISMNNPTLEQVKQTVIEFFSAGRSSDAEQVLEKAVASNQVDEEILSALAVRYQAAGRLDESIELFHQALALNPSYTFAAFNLGKSLQIGGRNEEAILAFARAIELDPSLPEAHVASGSALLACARTLDAIEAFREAVRIKPDFADGVFNLANALMANDQIEEACTFLYQLIITQRDLIPRLQLMGEQHLQLRRLASSKAIFRLVLAINDDYNNAILGLSLSLGFNNEVEGALQIVDQGLLTQPDWIPGYWLKILLLEALGRENQAVETRNILLNILSEADRSFNRKPVLPQILQITNLPRIGHLIAEVDCYLRSKIRAEGGLRNKVLFVKYDGLAIANAAFLPLVDQYFAIVELPHLLAPLRPPRCFEVIDCNSSVTNIGGRSDLFELHGSLPPDQVLLYSLPDEYRSARLAMFETVNISVDAKYVCLHVREGGYSPRDEVFHEGRNSAIASFMAAVNLLASLGIYTIRMGDKTMTPAPEHPFLFDYALSPLKSDSIDFALAAETYFFLGTASGAYNMSAIFGKPIVCVNMCLPFNFSPTGATNQIGIPKLPRSKESNELVPWPMLYRTRASDVRDSPEFLKLYTMQENSPEEILEVAEEMHLRLSGNWTTTKEDERLQELVRALIPSDSMAYGTLSRCGSAFLRRYSHLLDY